MSLTPGTRLGPYEILAPIGAGGMGEVYRAKDTKLDREVAIKVLPAAVAQDRERLTRFEREAKVLASLNHPNIAQIYGIEERAIVMELVAGETLHGPLPLDTALNYAKQIAEALEAAHEKGITHRDLKPANIMITPDGVVKVLDFGLASAPSRDREGAASPENSPTFTMAATQAGMIMGTAAYMSPEQAAGKPVDKRSDIWSFGVVLWEMLTGTRLFDGETISHTLADVLKGDIDFGELPPTIPVSIRSLLKRCLDRNVKTRLQAIGEARVAIQRVGQEPEAVAIPAASRSKHSRWLWPSIAAFMLLALMPVNILHFRETPQSQSPTRTSVMLPAKRPVATGWAPGRSLALSPDGTQIVYVATNLDAPTPDQRGRNQLQLRSLATLAVRDLPGTTGAHQPFFSPDGQWVGFFTGTELKKISLSGGTPVAVMSKINAAGWAFGVWTQDNAIIFGTVSAGLRRVPADGGDGTALTTLDAAQGEMSHYFPTLVPSGRAVLFEVRYSKVRNPRIDAMMLDSGKRRIVLENAGAPVVLDSGHLLFRRGDTILVAPFDAERLTVTGSAVPLVDNVQLDSVTASTPVPELVVSRGGTLAYMPAVDTTSTLGLVGRDGSFERLALPPNNFRYPRVSPDGHSITFTVYKNPEVEVHVYDLARGSTTTLTQDNAAVTAPAWHPDGRSLAVLSKNKDAYGIFLKNLDGSERLLVALPSGATVLRSPAWSPDGKLLAYAVQTASHLEIWVLTMGDTPKAKPFHVSAASEFSPKFSPDGRWLAYGSDESGRLEVDGYVLHSGWPNSL